MPRSRAVRADEPPTPPAPRAHRRSWGFAAMLASLSMLGPVRGRHVPAGVSRHRRRVRRPPIALQQTLSVYLFAYAFMMLWHGALSDALGRRPIVLGGLVIFALGTLGCAIAGNIQSLWLLRALQGLSAGAGLVVGRAIIRDRFHGAEAQRMMSQMTLVFGLAPALAPIVGGLLLNCSAGGRSSGRCSRGRSSCSCFPCVSCPRRCPPAAAIRCVRARCGATTEPF